MDYSPADWNTNLIASGSRIYGYGRLLACWSGVTVKIFISDEDEVQILGGALASVISLMLKRYEK